jgi:hypothetical protein
MRAEVVELLKLELIVLYWLSLIVIVSFIVRVIPFVEYMFDITVKAAEMSLADQVVPVIYGCIEIVVDDGVEPVRSPRYTLSLLEAMNDHVPALALKLEEYGTSILPPP